MDNLAKSYFFQSLDDSKCTPKHLYNPDGGIVGLNPAWAKAEAAALDKYLDDAFADILDESPAINIHVEMELVELDELIDLPAAPLVDDTPTGDNTPTQSTANDLTSRQKHLFSGDFEYTDELQDLNREIASELTKHGIPPIQRDFPKYDRIACKNKSIAAYMLDLQAFDLLWVWATQRGHKTDSEAYNGIFEGIFCGDGFDWDKALQIAAIRKNAKDKAALLRLSEVRQEELLILRTEAVRRRLNEAKRRTSREQKDLMNSMFRLSIFVPNWKTTNFGHREQG